MRSIKGFLAPLDPSSFFGVAPVKAIFSLLRSVMYTTNKRIQKNGIRRYCDDLDPETARRSQTVIALRILFDNLGMLKRLDDAVDAVTNSTKGHLECFCG